MKTGIITFHRSINYGSALQAWALAHILSQMGAGPEIIDYEPNHYREMYSLFYPPVKKNYISTDLLHTILLPYYLRRNRDFDRFRKEQLPLGKKRYRSGDNISTFTEDKDVMVCGSDQIWNPMARDFDVTFLLGEVHNVKKISYAVSVGKSTFEKAKDRDYIRLCLRDFSYLSMREKTGAEAVRALLGDERSVFTDPDPTLLVEKEDFQKILAPRAVKEPYIFFYSVRLNKSALRAVREFSEKTGLPVYTCVSREGTMDLLRCRKSIRLAPGDAGPRGFVSLLANAEYVVTDSFHGTAISAVFEKEFYAVNDMTPGGKRRDDARIMNLLEALCLEERHIPAEKLKEADTENKIDYEPVTRRRRELAAVSKARLEKAIRE